MAYSPAPLCKGSSLINVFSNFGEKKKVCRLKKVASKTILQMCNRLEVLQSLTLRNLGRKNWLAVTAHHKGSARRESGRPRKSFQRSLLGF